METIISLTSFPTIPKIFANNNKLKSTFKTVLVGITLLCIFLNCQQGYGLPADDIKCINDASHNYTEDINAYLHENKMVTSLITMVSSLCIDICMLSVSYFWVTKGSSWRFWTSLSAFYLLRGLMQGVFAMRYPDGYLWDHPGLPSMAVSYLKTSDFFYSGHVGLPIIVACELFKNNFNKSAWFAIASCVLEFIVMTIMRGHYIIDLVTGVIIGHYIFIVVDKYIYIIDDSFLSLKDVNNVEDISEKWGVKKKEINNINEYVKESENCFDINKTNSNSNANANSKKKNYSNADEISNSDCDTAERISSASLSCENEMENVKKVQ